MVKINIRLFLLLLMPFSNVRYLTGQEMVSRDTVSVKLYFQQGYDTLSSSFRDNGIRFDSLLHHTRLFNKESEHRLRQVCIVSGASPEGGTEINRYLSDRRGIAARTYLKEKLALDTCFFKMESRGVDWIGLTGQIAMSDMPHRTEVLDILYNTPEWVIRDGAIVDSRKNRLQRLYGGRVWRYMEKFFFPELRRTKILFVYEPCSVGILKPGMAIPIYRSLFNDSTGFISTPLSIPLQPVEPIGGRSIYIGLKTNLLYCVALVPNLGMEFYLGKGWSAGGSWMYAWWKNDQRHHYWRIYGGELFFRKYFGSRANQKPLTGHHLGIYSQGFTYDFETGSRGYIGGIPGGTLWDKMNYTVGVEYGYSLPIRRRLNLDFVIGAGYWGGEFQKYYPENKYYVWKETGRRHWFGPTKAEVSLVWLLGKGYFNEKGGRK